MWHKYEYITDVLRVFDESFSDYRNSNVIINEKDKTVCYQLEVPGFSKDTLEVELNEDHFLVDFKNSKKQKVKFLLRKEDRCKQPVSSSVNNGLLEIKFQLNKISSENKKLVLT